MINPFTDEYCIQEIEFFGLKKYRKNSINIKTIEVSGRCDDYFNVWFRPNPLNIPTMLINNTLWMSLTPMEIQSHFIPIKRAKGNIAVGGIGLGYYLLRAMEKPTVKTIDAYEINTDVIKYFQKCFQDRPGYNKITFIPGDIHDTMINKSYDFAYIDTYQDMLPDNVITDKKTHMKNNKIKEYHFWAQEKIFKQALLDFNIYCLLPYKELNTFFNMWLKSEGASLKDILLNISIITDCLDTF